MHKRNYKPSLVFIGVVLLVSITGFWNLYFGTEAHANSYHHLHVFSSFLWLLLITVQLVYLDNKKNKRHRQLGYLIFFAGPFIVATLALLSVYSANRAAMADTEDALAVQNAGVTLEVGLLIFLGFLFKKEVKVHGAFILSSALMFMGIALFFTLLTFVPAYKIEGPETFENFGKAAAMATYISTAIGLLMFFLDWKHGWPWLLAVSFFYINAFVDIWVNASENLKPLTSFIGSFSLPLTFLTVFSIFLILLAVTWNRRKLFSLLQKSKS